MVEEGALREWPPEGGDSEPAPRPFLPHWGPRGTGGQCEGLGEATEPFRAEGVMWGPQVSPAYAFLGSFPGPSIPATDPDPNLGTLGALRSGETAHPRAL